jgi:hypothetical protein
MSEPTMETFKVLAVNQGVIALSEARLAQAAETHASFRADLEALRAVPLAFLGEVLEPDTALSWIERDGVPA